MAKARVKEARQGLAAALQRAEQSPRMKELQRAPKTPFKGGPVLRGFRDAAPASVPEEQDEDEFLLDIPPHHPDDVRAALGHALSAETVTEENLDVLWDWVRADPQGMQSFLGLVPKTSAEMRQSVAVFGEEHFYALYESTPHAEHALIGFTGLHPIMEKQAGVHLYLEPNVRGRGADLIGQLMTLASKHYPGRSFAVHTKDAAMARMLRPVGFSLAYFLQWAPSVTVTSETAPETGEDDGSRSR